MVAATSPYPDGCSAKFCPTAAPTAAPTAVPTACPPTFVQPHLLTPLPTRGGGRRTVRPPPAARASRACCAPAPSLLQQRHRKCYPSSAHPPLCHSYQSLPHHDRCRPRCHIYHHRYLHRCHPHRYRLPSLLILLVTLIAIILCIHLATPRQCPTSHSSRSLRPW